MKLLTPVNTAVMSSVSLVILVWNALVLMVFACKLLESTAPRASRLHVRIVPTQTRHEIIEVC